MRLLTHNMLQSHIKGVANGYPFRIEASKVVTKEADFNTDFLRHIFGRIEWNALLEGAKMMGVGDIPEMVDESMLDDDDFMRKFHHVLLEVDLEEGFLICPETGRRFSVERGIPNLLLREDEC
ncbi:hypothetical protein BSKO_09259 [Bryopsis sp. KO-2023]|nr:hypothetical protein BSKO_09259 [Bryopsis sp. KO-2023]